MRDYGKIKWQFWGDDDAKTLGDAEKLLFAYLISCGHANAIGCYYLPIGYIATDLNWSDAKATQTLSELSRKKFAVYQNGYVWVRQFIRHNQPENPKVLTHMQRLARALPNSLAFKHTISELLLGSFETVSERYRNPEPEPEPFPEPDPEPEPEPKEVKTTREPDGFGPWWKIYPKRVGKGTARAAYAKALEKGATPAELLLGASRYAKSPLRDEKFTKDPATWLNAECWSDEETHGPRTVADHIRAEFIDGPETDPDESGAGVGAFPGDADGGDRGEIEDDQALRGNPDDQAPARRGGSDREGSEDLETLPAAGGNSGADRRAAAAGGEGSAGSDGQEHGDLGPGADRAGNENPVGPASVLGGLAVRPRVVRGRHAPAPDRAGNPEAGAGPARRGDSRGTSSAGLGIAADGEAHLVGDETPRTELVEAGAVGGVGAADALDAYEREHGIIQLIDRTRKSA